MRVFGLTAENVKKLKIVNLDKIPADLVQVTGSNGAGKSSLLDSICWALGGKDEIQAVPVRKGEEKAIIKLDLGDVEVTRKFANGATTVEVMSRDGTYYKSPQKVLDAFLGHLSFDPLAFARLDSKKQYEELKRIVKIEVDLEALDEANKKDFEARTVQNRVAKDRKAQADGLAKTFQFEVIESPTDISAIAEQLRAASDANARIEKTKSDREMRDSRIEHLSAEILGKTEDLEAYEKDREQDLQKKIADHKATTTRMVQDRKDAIEGLVAGMNALEKQVESDTPLPEPQDLSKFQSEIKTAQSRNAEFLKRTDHKNLVAEANAAEKKSKELTDGMDARDRQKTKAIGEANMPIPGLTLDRGGVYLDGVPFDQASSAQQLKVSVAIAMAANPKLRVLLIRDGSLLDTSSLAMIQEMAADREYQIWVEQVDETGSVGVVMEDGEVKSVQPSSVKAPKKSKQETAK